MLVLLTAEPMVSDDGGSRRRHRKDPEDGAEQKFPLLFTMYSFYLLKFLLPIQK